MPTGYPPVLGSNFYQCFFEKGGLLFGIVEDVGNDMKHHYCNEACETFLRASKEQIIGNTSARMGFEQECIDRWIHFLHLSKETNQAQHFDFKAEHSGRRTWGLCTVFPLPGNPTPLPLYCYIVNDITEQKLFAMEQERIRNNLEKMIQNISGAVWEAEMDSQEKAFTFVSPMLNNILNTTVAVGSSAQNLEKSITASMASDPTVSPSTSPSTATAKTSPEAEKPTQRLELKGSASTAHSSTERSSPVIMEERYPHERLPACAGFVDPSEDADDYSKAYDFSLVHKNGVLRHFRNSVKCTIDAGVKKKVGILLDVSKEKEAAALQEQVKSLQLKQKMKSDIFANMSHEIRTPLNGIIGLGQLLQDTTLTSEQREYTNALVDCANSLLFLINDVLDLSKIEANKMTVNPVTFNFAELVEESAQLVAIKAHEKDIELLVNYDPTIRKTISGDSNRIRQVLVNLLGNAVKFTGTNGQIIVSVEACDDNFLKVLVTDNGVGIPKDKLNAIFERFEQVEVFSAEAQSGYGLGLDICRSIVRFLGGKIGVSSEPKKGSTFWFTVPLVTESSSSDSVGASDSVSAPPFQTDQKVLIVDSSRRYCEITARMMASWGLDAHFCTVAENAINQLENMGCYNGIRYSAYLITVWGDENIKKIGEISRRHNLKIIRAIHLGRTFPKNEEGELILKPLSSSRLKGSLKKLLRRPPRLPGTEENREDSEMNLADGDMFRTYSPRPGESPSESAVADFLKGSKRSAEAGDTSRLRKRSKKISLNVLLVDDCEVNLMVASKILESLGCSVTVAKNGLKAIEISREREFHIIFMDCQMPELDGFEATKQIREIEVRLKRRHTPLVALTGSSSQESVDKCLASGMDDFVMKPIGKNDFISLLNKHLAP